MDNQEIEIRRRILNVDEIDSNRHVPEKEPNSRKAANYFKNFASNIFPPIKWLPLYRKVYLPGDIISGLTVSMIRLPQVNGINFIILHVKSYAFQNDTKIRFRDALAFIFIKIRVGPVIYPVPRPSLWFIGWFGSNQWCLFGIFPMYSLLNAVDGASKLCWNILNYFADVWSGS